MKTVRLALLLTTMIGVIIGLTPVAWAGGAGNDVPCCVVKNPGGGALSIKGTMAVIFTPSDGEQPPSSDVKFRLERGGKFGFFQLNLNENIDGLNNEEITCVILNPEEPGTFDLRTKTAVALLVNQILNTFFPDSGRTFQNTRLVITRNSISFTDGPSGRPILLLPGDDSTDTGRSAGIGEVIIYAIDSDDVDLENPEQCPEP